MATAKATLFAVDRQEVPAAENPQIEIVPVPESYQAALSEGWYVTHEKTPLIYDKGELTMRNDLFSQAIRIRYRANSVGWEYDRPEAINE